MQEKLIIAAVLLLVGFGGGWAVNGWRLGEVVAAQKGENGQLKLSNDTLTSANQTCAKHITEVRASLVAFDERQQAIAKAVADAIAKAGPQAAAHLKEAERIMRQAAVPPEQWCPTIIKEQEAYVTLRAERRLKSLEGR